MPTILPLICSWRISVWQSFPAHLSLHYNYMPTILPIHCRCWHLNRCIICRHSFRSFVAALYADNPSLTILPLIRRCIIIRQQSFRLFVAALYADNPSAHSLLTHISLTILPLIRPWRMHIPRLQFHPFAPAAYPQHLDDNILPLIRISPASYSLYYYIYTYNNKIMTLTYYTRTIIQQ